MQNIGEGSLAIPADWHNSTVNIYTSQPPGVKGLSITVNRDRLPLGTTLSEYVSSQSKKLKEQVKDFQPIHDEAVVVDGKEGHVFIFTWNSPDAGEIHQILLTVADGLAVLNLAGTSVGKMNDQLRDQVVQMLLSFRYTASAA